MAARGLTQQVGLVAAGRLAQTLSVYLIVNIILSRAWLEAEFGLFAALWSLGNACIPVFLLGLPTCLLYFFPRLQPQQRGDLVWQFSVLLLGSGFLLAVGLYAAPDLFARWLGLEVEKGAGMMRHYLFPFLPYVLSQIMGGHIEPALVAAGRPQWQAWLALVGALGLVGAAWVGLVWQWSVAQVLLGFSLVGLVRLGLGLGLVGLAVGWGTRSWIGVGTYLRYAWPIGLNDSLGALSRSLDRLVVLAFLPLGSFAAYHLGAFEVPVSLLLAGVVTVLVPEVSRFYKAGNAAAIGRLWHMAVRRLALIILPMFAFLLVFAQPLITWVYPHTYSRSAIVFQVFLLMLPLRVAVYNPLLVGMGKARWVLWGSLGDLILNGVLSLMLVQVLKAWGSDWALLGPAVATVVATYLQVVFLIGVIGRQLSWKVGDLLPWGYLLWLGGLSCLAVLIAWMVANGLKMPWAQVLVGGVVFVVLFGGLLVLRPADREELLQIRNSLLGR
jgi:O-antigen/teichoic acid export membrane protein